MSNDPSTQPGSAGETNPKPSCSSKFWPVALLVVIALAGVIWVGASVFRSTAGAVSNQPPPEKVDVPALEEKVKAGDQQAIIKLAQAYASGLGVRPNIRKAAELYRQAVDKGNSDAMAALGELYQSGRLGSNGPAMAVELYRKAAEKGSVSGQYNLGYCYERGEGVDNDEKQATTWYRLAAEGGDATAQYDMAQRCALGLGTNTDLIEAYKWYLLAYKQGQPDAKAKMSALKSKLDSQQMKEGESRASEFHPRASK